MQLKRKLVDFDSYLERIKNEPVRTIYIDMDGVLADLHGKMREIGISFDREPGLKQVNPGVFFKMAKEKGFFKDLKKLPFNKIFNLLKEKKDLKVKILGSIGSKANSFLIEHKTQWLKDNIDFNFDEIIFVPGKRFKKDYATSDSLLIDDTQSNTDQFKAAGGKSILHKNEDKTLNALINYLKK